jgi:hypothetical protein
VMLVFVGSGSGKTGSIISSSSISSNNNINSTKPSRQTKTFRSYSRIITLFSPALKTRYLEEQLQKLLVQQVSVLQSRHNGDTLSKQ